MKPLAYLNDKLALQDILEITGITGPRIKLLRQRDQIAGCFGLSEMYVSGAFVPQDAVALYLVDVLAREVPRNFAVQVVRQQWGVWLRTIAVCETYPNKPVFFLVLRYRDQSGREGYMSTGSMLDTRDPDALQLIANDVQARTGVAPRSFVAVEMQQVLHEVRLNAERAGFDFSKPFMPKWGDPLLEEILKPYAETDTGIVTVGDAAKSATSKKAAAKARELLQQGVH